MSNRAEELLLEVDESQFPESLKLLGTSSAVPHLKPSDKGYRN